MSVSVKPKPKFKLQGVDFADLTSGDCFLYGDCLMIKLSKITDNQQAVDLATGDSYIDMRGGYVRPVDVEIKWT